jgi:2-succinyl-5-enolpyruvyl-6-hydroxy-3-cyclohexene-1-carboxylate synthase
MDLTNETFAPLRVLIDEYVRAGVQHAVVSPGSRNAPIAYALGDRSEIRTWSVLDERQAGFFALGLAKSTGSPVIVCCTSGTATANLHPAVIEADHAGVPLILLTADRPPELRDNGAGQTIDQVKLYGDSVRWFVDAASGHLSDETLRHFRQLGARSFDAATGANPGPVHVNLPLREPLQPVPGDLGELAGTLGAEGRPGGARWSAASKGSRVEPALIEALAVAERPLFVVGEQNVQGLALQLAELAARTGAPLLADSLSQCRREDVAEIASVIAAYDQILRSNAVTERMQPDLIVRIGELPTSKPLRAWLSTSDCRQIAIDPRARLIDPTRAVTDFWAVDPLAAVENALDAEYRAADPAQWQSVWAGLERAAQSAADAALAELPFPSEPAVYRTILRELDAATVWVSSSMPIRDVEAFGPASGNAVRFLANRGTNGIDGVLSSAIGAIAPYNCDRLVLLTGDLAFLYDASALAIAERHGIELTIVCVDNSGGGIFSMLPLAEHPAHFEELIATPPSVDPATIAAAHGLNVTAPSSEDELLAAVEEPGLIHLKTSRTDSRQEHDRVAARVQEAVAAALADSGS